jgi:hypothetical protein
VSAEAVARAKAELEAVDATILYDDVVNSRADVAASARAMPNLAQIWTITGTDVNGTSFSGSTITFQSQVAAGADFSVTGFFSWIGSSGSSGRENFVGTLFADNRIELNGTSLEQSTHLGLAKYRATVTADGVRMINGSWLGLGIPCNNWTAVAATP